MGKAWQLLNTPGAVAPDPEHRGTYLVKGSKGNTYRVQLLTIEPGVTTLTCTCQHGQVHGLHASCYHVEAVRMLLRGEQ